MAKITAYKQFVSLVEKKKKALIAKAKKNFGENFGQKEAREINDIVSALMMGSDRLNPDEAALVNSASIGFSNWVSTYSPL